MAEQGGRGGVHSDSVLRVLPSVSYQMGPRTEAALGMIRRYIHTAKGAAGVAARENIQKEQTTCMY